MAGIELPSSGEINYGSDGNRVYVRRLTYGRGANYQADIPVVGYSDPIYGNFRSYSVRPGPGYLTLELVYDTSGGTTFSPQSGDTVFWAQTSSEEKPIEYHPDYKVRWNYGLYSANDGIVPQRTTADYPGGDAAYLIATNQDALLANTKLQWFHDDPGREWVKIKNPSKRFDYYLVPTRQVFQRDYFSSQATAEAALAQVGGLATPAETFGTGGTWLVTGSNTQYDGRHWVTETTYLNGTWDTDIYTTTTT